MPNITIEQLAKPSMIRCWAHDRVTVNYAPEIFSASMPAFSIVPVIYSEFESGPNLRHLAEIGGVLLGVRDGWFSLHSCQRSDPFYQPNHTS